MTKQPVIKSKDRETILNALRSGVVPRIGLQHIQVGRKREIEAGSPIPEHLPAAAE